MNIIYEEQEANIPLSQFIMRLGNVTINNIIITNSITTNWITGTTQEYKVTGAIILIEPKVSIHTPESDLEASEQDAIDLRKKPKGFIPDHLNIHVVPHFDILNPKSSTGIETISSQMLKAMEDIANTERGDIKHEQLKILNRYHFLYPDHSDYLNQVYHNNL